VVVAANRTMCGYSSGREREGNPRWVPSVVV
jgi:hypothetical protein